MEVIPPCVIYRSVGIGSWSGVSDYPSPIYLAGIIVVGIISSASSSRSVSYYDTGNSIVNDTIP